MASPYDNDSGWHYEDENAEIGIGEWDDADLDALDPDDEDNYPRGDDETPDFGDCDDDDTDEDLD